MLIRTSASGAVDRCYYFPQHSEYAEVHRVKAIADWYRQTNVRLVPLTPQNVLKGWIYFVNRPSAPRCYAKVGLRVDARH